MNRRGFLQSAAGASLLGRFAGPRSQTTAPIPSAAVDRLPGGLTEALGREIAGYMAKQNAPGLTFSLTDLEEHALVAAYGFEDLDTKKPLITERLFEIGSISKSMAAIVALQLVDEGKLDLERPVMDYLNWLPWETPFGPVNTHHIFTHTTGLPGGGDLFFPKGGWKHHQRYAPGERFFYSNMAFNVIGHLVEKLDGGNYQRSLAKRLLEPLGMSSTLPMLGGSEWELQATSYIPAAPDRPYPPFGKLRQAPAFHEQTSAGCVASTPGDMLKYLRFLLRSGISGDGKPLITPQSFEKMTHRWIGAEEFGPTAGYGYGIAVDQDGEDRILLHTGGMVSFMSSIYLNLTQGIGAFASINAQQGYRPTPVTRCATRALKAAKSGGKVATPGPITVPDQTEVAHAAEYAGVYETGQGPSVTIEAKGSRLQLKMSGKVLPLEGVSDSFLVDDATVGIESWKFERNSQKRIVGLAHGAESYTKQGETMPKAAEPPFHWQALVGDYVNDDPWVLSSAVFVRNGTLFLDGDPLEAAPNDSFYINSEPMSPDRLSFACEIGGKMHILLVNGTELRRFRRTV